jgi:hypothetical protein
MRSNCGSSNPHILQSLANSAVRSDLQDFIICPVGDRQFATLFGLIPDTLAVMRTAARIEPDATQLLDWYLTEKISDLGGLTADVLVNLGRAAQVIDFLNSVSRAEHLSVAVPFLPQRRDRE